MIESGVDIYLRPIVVLCQLNEEERYSPWLCLYPDTGYVIPVAYVRGMSGMQWSPCLTLELEPEEWVTPRRGRR